MSKSKLTLIIDGNWLLMSRMSVMQTRYTNPTQMCKDLKILMIKSINIVLRQFGDIDNIIFVADGGSWRNHVEIPDFLKDEDVEYKGNREPDPGIDWDIVWAMYEDFITKFNQNGITAVKETSIEGDDWCWYWSTKLNSEGTNVIIWSRDKDLTQLVRTNENGVFTVCWSKESGLICEEKNEDELNFLFNPIFTENDTIFGNISKKSGKVTKINPNIVVIDKIIRGDQGDNILPIILRNSKSGGDKKYKVSSKDIDFDLAWKDDNAVRGYIDNLMENKNYKERTDKTSEQVFEHFEYNKQLVALDRSSYPDEVMEVFAKYQDYNCSKDISEIDYQVNAEANNIKSIAELI